MKLKYQEKNPEGAVVGAEADRALFGAEGISLDLNARSVIMSPEFEMERIMALMQASGVAIVNPMEKVRIMGELWNRYVAASRAQDPEKLKLNELLPQIPGMMGPDGLPAIPAIPGAIAPVPNPGATRAGGSGAGGLKSLLSSLGAGNSAERVRG